MPVASRSSKSISQRVELIYNGAHFLKYSGARMASIQFQFRRHYYLAKFRPGFFALCLLFFCLMCYLGVWQLHRYHFKQTLLTDYQQRASNAPAPFTALALTADLQFQHVKVQGELLDSLTMLVENRVHDGHMGFEVVTPLQIKGQDKLLLVDRGWVAEPPRFTGAQSAEITGVIKFLNEYQFILGKNILQPDVTPLRMQKIDTQEISKSLQKEVYPFVLRLDANAQHGFLREWTMGGMTPERHMGYAVQWFIMAAVLLCAYFCFCIERVGPVNNASAK
jgi:surfeit locus 1 family protein